MEYEDKDEQELSDEEIKEMREGFDKDIWPEMKITLKGMSKKDACFVSFVAGCDLTRKAQEEEFNEAREKLSKMSDKEIEEVIKKGSEGELWSEGNYLENVNPNDSNHEERMKYFHEKDDDKKEHSCKKCNKPIGKHNLYWHEEMCNDCFFDDKGM